jgi:3-methyladenine DNA glycosylase/8-oxoguanine DNA glycosylase
VTEAVEAEVRLAFEPDAAAILGPLRRGRHDPAMRRDSDGRWWRAALTPHGPVTQSLKVEGRVALSRTWGAGAHWQGERTAQLLGAWDAIPSGFTEALDAALPVRHGHQPISAGLHRWRVPRSENVWETLLAAVLEQRVTGEEARSTWAALLRDHGTRAPGPAPAGLTAPPDPATVRGIPSWWWRRHGVDRQRSDTIMRLTRLGHILEGMLRLPVASARDVLQAVPGVGPWTCAEVAQRALGDPDAVSVGDYHLAGQVVYAFTGAFDGTDDQMLELLAPFAGQRYRVVRAIERAGITRPRRGPRMTIPAHIRG